MSAESMNARLKTSEKLMFIQRSYESADELITAAGKAAVALGYAEEGYISDVIEREKEYPTGLNAVMPIAIPHVGTHCLESFMSLTTLRQPLAFAPMDGRGDSLPVRIVFVFGLVDHRDQVKVLQRLAKMFKDKEALTKLIDAGTDAEGCHIIQDYLGDLVEIV
jgi:PTS system galactitol-specific IIA component